MKKTLCILLSVIIMTTFFSLPVTAAGNALAETGDYTDTTGDCSYTYTTSTKTLRIYGSGAMEDLLVTTPNPFSLINIETVVIEDGVTHIGDYAFGALVGIKEVSIADSVKSIGKGAFQYCLGLKSLKLPKNLETIGEDAFLGCENIKGELVIPDNVENISEHAFRGCKSITKLTVGEKTEFISEGAFMDCISLEEIDCRDLVTIGKYGFKNCVKMQKVNIGSVQVIGEEAFANNLVLGIVETSPDLFLAMGAFKDCQAQAIVFLSRMCILENDRFGADSIREGTVICGYTGSSAERYATKYGRTFLAIADNDVLITKVELNVTDPEVGEKPSYDATIPSAYANQYEIDDFSSEDGSWTHGMAWYDVTDARRITPDETFKGGHAYEVCAYLTPKQGYRFFFSQIGTAEGSINGKKAEFEFNKPDTRNPMIFYDYPALAITYTDLNEMSFTVAAPAYGEAPAAEAQTTSEGVTVTDVSWSGIAAGETFGADTEYTVNLTVAADEAYLIADTATALINNENASVTVAADGVTASVSYTFPALSKPAVIIRGDADGDGDVNIYDASLIQISISGRPTESFDEQAADADGDGTVTIFDASEIQRWLVHFPANDAIGQPIA